MDGPPARLDLSRPRAFGELMSTTFQVFGRSSAVVLTAALLLITPVAIGVDGIWGRALAEGVDARPSSGAQAASLGLRVLLVVPLMTALSAVVVQELGRGAEPTLRDALGAAARRLPAVIGAIGLYVIGVSGGLVLLIVPGVWLLVLWYFAAQAAVVESASPVQAVRRSTELVKGSWWRVFGLILATGLLFGLAGAIATAIIGSIGSTALYVSGLIVVEAVAVSLTGIFAALLFFDLRVRTAGLLAPERP
ncbi:MAG TPA: hypothetical protein VHF51_00565 [Solirubrobacteraceae bacterium]|nr:hypothetical protein [Solirubrobacteraceae bacterium]